MKIKNTIRIVFFLGLLFSLININTFGHKPPQISHYRFIENKGQWNDSVLFKVDLGHGALFIEKNAFTYNLLHPETFSSLHGGSSLNVKKENKKVKGHAYRVEFGRANPSVNVNGEGLLPEYFNYFSGSDESKWASDVKAYTKVLYRNLYEGIDLRIYTHHGNLKYDLIIHPGADPGQIKIKYKGIDKIRLKEGNLVLSTNIGEIIESKPVAHQVGEEGQESGIRCLYSLKSDNELTFNFPDGFADNQLLVIDPELIFSTYSGSFANNFGYTATFDSKGFLYSGSTVFGFGYPTTFGAYDRSFSGGQTDIAISKYDTTGTFMIYSTYIGGSGSEMPHSMICNSQDELFVFGTSGSSDFPTTESAYDRTFNNERVIGNNTSRFLEGMGIWYVYGCDIVVFRLSAQGNNLDASTYLGGSLNDGINSAARDSNFVIFNNRLYYDYEDASVDSLRYNYADEVRGEIDIDKNNNIYISTCTSSPDFPIVGNTFQQNYGGGRLDGVVVKMDNSLSSVIWSSFLGGSGSDAPYSLALSKNEDVYIAGGTSSIDFPVTDSVYTEFYSGGRADGFISYFDKHGEILIRSSYFGSEEYDQIYFVETDFKDDVYVLGQTEGKGDAFIHNVDYSVPNSGQFISKFSTRLDTLKWSTAFGTGSGSPDISPTAFLVDVCRKIYLSGWGGISNQHWFLDNNAGFTNGLPVTDDAFQKTTDGSDFYLMVIEDDASALHYATFMGGGVSGEHVDGGTSRFDKKGKVYQSVCAGCGENSDFPVKPNDAVSSENNSSCNNAVFKFDFDLPAVVADFDVPDIGCAPYVAEFENNSLEQSATEFTWDFGDGTISNERNPSHTYTKAGKYIIKLKVEDKLTCNLEDSISKEIVILSDTAYSLPPQNICPGQSAQIGFLPNTNEDVTYQWQPALGLSNPTVSNPIAKPDATTSYQLLVSNGVCTDTIEQIVKLNPVTVNATDDSIICSSDPPVLLSAVTTGNAKLFHWSNYPDFSDRINPDPTETSVIVAPLAKESYYYLRAENEFGCFDVDSMKISVSDYRIEVSPDVYMCNGDSARLKVASSLEEDSLIYEWTPKAKIPGRTDTSEIVVYPAEDTYYYITTTNKYGCQFTDSVFVDISVLTPAGLTAYSDKDTVFSGERTQLHARPSVDIFSYIWTPDKWLDNPFISDPVATPRMTTLYNVNILDNIAGCELDTNLEIIVVPVVCDEPNIFVPNAFTPNGDGNNDILYVRGSGIKDMHFIIYDRWGEKVFESFNPEEGWDGYYKGMKADPAVFTYYLEVWCYGEERFFKKGNITLLK